MEELLKFFQTFADYLIKIIPPFLIASLFAAFLGKKISDRSLSRIFSRGKSSIVLSSLIGAPLPICSCTILPLAYALKRRGVPSYSIVPFLISAPSVSLPSLLISLSLLGPYFTLAYVCSAIGIALAMGTLEYLFPSLEEKGHLTGHCHFSFKGMLKELIPPILIGTAIASAISLIPVYAISRYLTFPAGLVTSIGISLPLYICSSGSVPIVASLYQKGLFFGGGIIILLLGPATNVSSILVLSKTFGSKFTLRYVILLALLAVFFAFLFSLIF